MRKSPTRRPKSQRSPSGKQRAKEGAVSGVAMALPAVPVIAPRNPLDEILESSKSFLEDQELTLDASRAFFGKMSRYLEGLRGAGNIALFLLSGRPMEVFTQVFHFFPSLSLSCRR